MNKKYTAPLPPMGYGAGSRKTSWDGSANKKPSRDGKNN